MSYINSNPNPDGILVDDCVVRAICIAENREWMDVYMDICAQGGTIHDMPSSNYVWGEYLKSRGYSKYLIETECKSCYKLKDFCSDHAEGTYIVGTGYHVVAVIDGDYYDTEDSGNCIPLYYYHKEASEE